MTEKKYSGNFYKKNEEQKMAEDCPNCLYPNKKVEKLPEECPNCMYRPQKKNSEEDKK